MDEPRSRAARAAAEGALVRVVHHYGERPGFVVLGGLVADWLCAGSELAHAGTTDVDVQVDFEISAGSVNATKLERALRGAGFEPDAEHVWRWVAGGRVVIKFELLADLDDTPSEATVRFDSCDRLGAVNLRGTGFAARDVVLRRLEAHVDGTSRAVQVNVTGLAGFLLAKTAAARSRRKAKDWYDIAFVLQHNDAGGVEAAARAVLDRFGADLTGAIRTALNDLRDNFATADSQGPRAYVEQMLVDYPDLDATTVAADAIVAVEAFHRALFR